MTLGETAIAVLQKKNLFSTIKVEKRFFCCNRRQAFPMWSQGRSFGR